MEYLNTHRNPNQYHKCLSDVSITYHQTEPHFQTFLKSILYFTLRLCFFRHWLLDCFVVMYHEKPAHHIHQSVIIRFLCCLILSINPIHFMKTRAPISSMHRPIPHLSMPSTRLYPDR